MPIRQAILQKIKEYLVLTFGTFVFCFPWSFFMIPNGMSSGGVTGLCTVIQYATGGLIPLDLSYAVLNIFLLIVGFIVLGGKFGIKTIYCIVLSTVLFKVLPMITALQCLPGHFLFINERFLIPVISGMLEGLGLGIILREGGSTGGTDIIAMMINKFWPVSPGTFYLVSDMVIITSIIFLPDKSFADMIYGYLMMIVSAQFVDFVVLGSKKSVQLMVFSDKYEEIADYIINEMDRGVTLVHAQGWFTKQEREVLLILVRQRQLTEITKVIKNIDHKAFVSVTHTSSVYGEGFEEIKTGINRKKNKDNATESKA